MRLSDMASGSLAVVERTYGLSSKSLSKLQSAGGRQANNWLGAPKVVAFNGREGAMGDSSGEPPQPVQTRCLRWVGPQLRLVELSNWLSRIDMEVKMF